MSSKGVGPLNSKQSRDIVEFPQVERHLLDHNPNGGVDPSGCFTIFFSED